MKDRQPTYPGRVKLVPVAGQENTFDMVRADEPTEEGTPLNKATLLKDTTAALYGLDDAVPDDVFALLKLGNGYRAYSITLLYPDGTPASGFTITGLTSISGASMTTDSTGKVPLGKASGSSVTITAKNTSYTDFSTEQSFSVSESTTDKKVEITKWGILVTAVLTLAIPSTTEATYTSSTTVTLSNFVKTVDFCLVGGGGGGGGSAGNSTSAYSGGGGGGGGYVTNSLAVAASKANKFTVSVGSGGSGGACNKNKSAGTAGSNGGTTTVTLADSSALTAAGGSGGSGAAYSVTSTPAGGSGNGSGGRGGCGANASTYYAKAGSSASSYKFNDSSLGYAGGGGGGGGFAYSTSPCSGGSPNGGIGGYGNEDGSTAPASGSVPGGGGGGGVQYNGASGGNGRVFVRWHY